MLSFEQGIEHARALIQEDSQCSLPKNLSDEMLDLLVFASEDEQSNTISLPIMLVIHLWRSEKNGKVDDSALGKLHHRFCLFKHSCFNEVKRRRGQAIFRDEDESEKVIDFASYQANKV